MIKEIKVPDIGEKVESMTCVGVLVKAGDSIEVDQGIIEVETSKAMVEIPSPEKGVITEILVSVDDELKIGQLIAKIDTAGNGASSEKSEEKIESKTQDTEKQNEPDREPAKETSSEDHSPSIAPMSLEDTIPVEERPERAIQAAASPSVRRLARQLGADVNLINGSGPGGRISLDDVKAYVKTAMTSITHTATQQQKKTVPLPNFSKYGDVNHERLSTVRKLIAEGISHAWNSIPQVTQFDKADITGLEVFRKKLNDKIPNKEGKITVTAILMKILAEGLKKNPRFNASIDMDKHEMIYKDYIHISIAVDTERGLLVPVVKDVDKKGIKQLAIDLNDIAERTRTNKISPDELEGGTFTISNQGGIGGTNFTPIVNWPQCAILGVSRAEQELRLKGDSLEQRLMLPLSLSYDHRIVDGADASRFLRWVCDALTQPLTLFLDN
ncbi:MAG: branched-chain alpha-keto acid dehydrogenase subunit E2 [Calditrichaeota bacterium]|nr:MAG: branched-chain alpha-keto acid dehydrogenase subunit E2 [Calditrichota bacterium]